MILNKQYFQDKDLEVKEKKLKLPVLEALIQGRKNIIKGSSSDSQEKVINSNGHEYIDLGLSSGTLWATMNIEASSETDYGNYYLYGKGADTYQTTREQTAYLGMEDPLDLLKDTARQVWDGDWHTPTKEQFEELIANTTYLFVTNYEGSGINGGLFTAQNGNHVFLPAAGDWLYGSQSSLGSFGSYWSSSPNNNNAYYLLFDNDEITLGNITRYGGFSIRPVIG